MVHIAECFKGPQSKLIEENINANASGLLMC